MMKQDKKLSQRFYALINQLYHHITGYIIYIVYIYSNSLKIYRIQDDHCSYVLCGLDNRQWLHVCECIFGGYTPQTGG